MRIIRFCNFNIFSKLVVYVLAQTILQYWIYGKTRVQYKDLRASAEIKDFILLMTPIDLDILREMLLM